MYTWTLLAITVGVVVVVFQFLLFLGLLIKVRKRKDECVPQPEIPSTQSPGKSMCVTDPYSGKLVNLERVSNASSLRSTRSVGFISYDKSEGSHSRGRVTPLFGNGSINSAKLNHSMASVSSLSLGQEFKQVNLNPLFKEDSPQLEKKSGLEKESGLEKKSGLAKKYGPERKHDKLRAREI